MPSKLFHFKKTAITARLKHSRNIFLGETNKHYFFSNMYQQFLCNGCAMVCGGVAKS